MLSVIFRGFFLISILFWYSTSVWRMIDDYFKDQFQRYLEDEYQRNPAMKLEVGRENVSKEESGVINGAAVGESSSAAPEVEGESSVGKASLGRIARGGRENSADKMDSLEICVENANNLDEETRESVDHQKRKSEVAKDGNAGSHSGTTLPRDSIGDDGMGNGGAIFEKGEERRIRLKKKNQDKSKKNNAGLLKEHDFVSVRRSLGRRESDDFWEFEDEGEAFDGVLVSDLPYRSKVDLADLERVSAEEFCPLTAEDEESCGERSKWP
ncbi:uncharacterized protein Xport-B [Prorops nasuta]|uniref:uncharacterized protein Xport-B n=1 Tax=Prorops nasuta TaxID=863751 RepID=UPI0034CDB6AA